MKETVFSKEQIKTIKQLERLFKKCKQQGLCIFSNNSSLYCSNDSILAEVFGDSLANNQDILTDFIIGGLPFKKTNQEIMIKLNTHDCFESAD